MDLCPHPPRRFLLFCLLFRWSLASTDYFLFPPIPAEEDKFGYNPTYTVGSKIDLWWKTTYPSIKLTLWQVADNEASSSGYYPSQTFFDDHAPVESMQWEVDVSKFNTIAGTVFFFEIFNAAFTNSSFTCHYFNVTTVGTTTTQSVVTAVVPSSGAVTATVTPEVAYTNGALMAYSAPTTSTTSSGTTRSTSSSTSTPKPNHGLSSGAKTGIGVGVGIGAAGILGGAAVGWYLYRRNKKRPERSVDPVPDQPNNMEYDGGAHAKHPPTYAYQYAPLNHILAPAEMDGTRPPLELPDEASQKPGELAGNNFNR